MNSAEAVLDLRRAGATKRVRLSDYLTPDAAERAEVESIAWIKALRHARVDGVAMRDRFVYRDDSLWWFAEIYLHKTGTVAAIHRVLRALDSLIAQETPEEIRAIEAGEVARGALPPRLHARGIGYRGAARRRHGAATPMRALIYSAEAALRRLRPGRRVAFPPSRRRIAAFVHSAFWRPGAENGESYVGPVLDALAERLDTGELSLIGVGPRTNYRARGWRDRLSEWRDPAGQAFALTPIEALADWPAVRPSFEWWRNRHAVWSALTASPDIRAAAHVLDCDVWPLVAEELRGVSHLQFPWSARAMDEAAAALDALRPDVAVTYAEAGGWGRALALEARTRGIPLVGLQHGFIYRHWLNYLHEADEMAPSPDHPADRGFPRPALTLAFDRFTATHLEERGRFPPDSLRVTGSPRLDALVAAIDRLSADERRATRAAVGAQPAQRLVLLAAKFTQARDAIGPLLAAVRTMPDVRLVIKPHPAESAAPYEQAAAGAANIFVAAKDASLAALLAESAAVVTVNSTVAIDALVLGIPALVLALPNNLSPFVDAGAMAGVRSGAETGAAIRSLLYDNERRVQLAASSRAFLARYAIASDGRAAARSAEAILGLVS